MFLCFALNISSHFRIHPRYKQDIADRLFLAARNVAYGEQEIKIQGPFPTGLQLDASTNLLTVEYDNGKDVLQVNTNNGFEVRNKVKTCFIILQSSSYSYIPVLLFYKVPTTRIYLF